MLNFLFRTPEGQTRYFIHTKRRRRRRLPSFLQVNTKGPRRQHSRKKLDQPNSDFGRRGEATPDSAIFIALSPPFGKKEGSTVPIFSASIRFARLWRCHEKGGSKNLISEFFYSFRTQTVVCNYYTDKNIKKDFLYVRLSLVFALYISDIMKFRRIL